MLQSWRSLQLLQSNQREERKRAELPLKNTAAGSQMGSFLKARLSYTLCLDIFVSIVIRPLKFLLFFIYFLSVSVHISHSSTSLDSLFMYALFSAQIPDEENLVIETKKELLLL